MTRPPRRAPAADSPPPQVEDPAESFLERLMVAVREGQRLDDPRDMKVLQRWVGIVRNLPDSTIVTLIPGTIRRLFQNRDLAPALAACGLTPDQPMQHDAIAAFVMSYRRFEKRRKAASGESRDRDMIQNLRDELRALNQQFQAVLDQALKLEEERGRLTEENASLQQQLLATRMEHNHTRRRLADTRQRTFRLFRLYLFMLKEEHERRSNDPRRLITAEISTETYWATLESLGWEKEAADAARSILGEELFGLYGTNRLTEEQRLEQAKQARPPAPKAPGPVPAGDPQPRVHHPEPDHAPAARSQEGAARRPGTPHARPRPAATVVTLPEPGAPPPPPVPDPPRADEVPAPATGTTLPAVPEQDPDTRQPGESGLQHAIRRKFREQLQEQLRERPHPKGPSTSPPPDQGGATVTRLAQVRNERATREATTHPQGAPAAGSAPSPARPPAPAKGPAAGPPAAKAPASKTVATKTSAPTSPPKTMAPAQGSAREVPPQGKATATAHRTARVVRKQPVPAPQRSQTDSSETPEDPRPSRDYLLGK